MSLQDRREREFARTFEPRLHPVVVWLALVEWCPTKIRNRSHRRHL